MNEVNRRLAGYIFNGKLQTTNCLWRIYKYAVIQCFENEPRISFQISTGVSKAYSFCTLTNIFVD